MSQQAGAEWRNYVSVFCASSALVIAAVTALNYQVDPYLTHQWQTQQLQQLRPGREKLSAWGKTYALAKFKPTVLYVGNSRTELGLPTRATPFADLDVFNGALSGASLGDAMAMVDHAEKVGQLKTLVWGIDAPSFTMEIGNTDFDRELVANGPLYLWRRTLINVRRAFAFDMTADSIRVLRGTFGSVCHSSLASYGQRDDACVHERIEGLGGTGAAIVPRVREYLRGAGPTDEAMRALDRSMANVCGAGTRVRLYLNPTHAMTADALYWAGKWPPMEAWQRSLASMGQRYRAAGCDMRIFDFSGFNSVTTEAIPQVSKQPAMRYYWETSHYRSNVGSMVLARMFGGGDVPADFGAELSPESVEAHQAAVRLARERYHHAHPAETSMVRSVVAER
ncbi:MULTISPECIES: hypothetical protein [unclassified Duganella]|uniref:hypothetical protein n=1 Tax=unclassified Duganella TaxID=2636909 RepID=UPI000E34F071|nr:MULTISPECIES: hypothetical protein [unclassified Duganella]RFP19491.1 hypothetical protein D0T23_06890 [Duganella sp. BJB475]RFP36072.1 hypothetical protein D0T21_06435 [Duganella sp. BJB476]